MSIRISHTYNREKLLVFDLPKERLRIENLPVSSGGATIFRPEVNNQNGR